jgi:hypothetical protein
LLFEEPGEAPAGYVGHNTKSLAGSKALCGKRRKKEDASYRFNDEEIVACTRNPDRQV